jgi:hypothetical protein
MALRFQTATKRYPSPGVCIYCGRADVKLTDEHIVPLGLGGNLVFEKSSCVGCAKVTGNVEQQCLRGMFAPLRARLGFPSRRRKDQKRSEPLFVVRLDDTVESRDVTLLEHPAGLALMRVEPPRILYALPPLTGEFKGDIWWTYVKDDTRQKIEEHGGKGVRFGAFNPGLFARMLAKIAHAFAVADQGLNKFTPLLPRLILGRDENLSSLVGGSMVVPPAFDALHQLELEVGWIQDVDYTKAGLPANTQFLIIHIRLFSFLAAPLYHVVAGIWNEPR